MIQQKQGCVIVTDEQGSDIVNVVNKYKAYDTDFGAFRERESREMTRTSGGFITFGETVARGLESCNFLSKIPLQTTSEHPEKETKNASANSIIIIIDDFEDAEDESVKPSTLIDVNFFE